MTVVNVESNCKRRAINNRREMKGWRDKKTLVYAPEYEDCARIARANQVSLHAVYEAARAKCGEMGR